MPYAKKHSTQMKNVLDSRLHIAQTKSLDLFVLTTQNFFNHGY